jgi:hypothetical protein
MLAYTLLALALGAGVAAPLAIDAGKATGTATIDGTTTPLRFAVETQKENLFVDKQHDTVYVLTDKELVTTKPDDEVGLSMKARRGELVAFALRVDHSTLVNVTISHQRLNGLVILPGSWFQFTLAKAGAGTLKLAKRDFDGHAYAVDVEFAASRYIAPRPRAAPAPVSAPAPRSPAAPPLPVRGQ